MISASCCEFPDFAWVVGEEGSDPVVLRDGTPYRHDQFTSSGHYGAMAGDLADVAALGVRIFRYGMPWRLTETAPGQFDWTLWDRAFAACDAAGLEPVVDLCHFGLPDHYLGFCDATWVNGFCHYVDAFLTRYPGPRWFTPVNEPAVTAMASARLGAWNDRRTSWNDYGTALANLVHANLEAVTRVRGEHDGCWIGSEGFDIPVAATPADRDRANRRRQRNWLVWDLHFGIEPGPAARDLLVDVPDGTLERIASLATTDGVIAGHDVYPTSMHVLGDRETPLTIDERLDAYVDEARRWYARYHVPFWIAETSNLSLPVSDQIGWLHGFVNRLRAMRAEELPVRGLCWYSRGDQYDWQTMLLEPTGALTEVGLFDAARNRRAVADAFAEFANAPSLTGPHHVE